VLEVVKFLGAEKIERKLEVCIPSSRSFSLEAFLKDNNIASTDFIIGINPGSRRPSRRWPAEYFAALADKLRNSYNAKIVITGTRNELKLAKRIKQISAEGVFISSGQLSLVDFVNFIRMCKLFITNDTGPMHIASALGVPLVAIMGGGSKAFCPYNNEKAIILSKEVSCRPCYKLYCSKLDCLKSISPEEAKQAADSLLKQV
jgi:heptosyltransferase-2